MASAGESVTEAEVVAKEAALVVKEQCVVAGWGYHVDLHRVLSWEVVDVTMLTSIGHWAGCGAVEAPGSSCLLSILLSLGAAADSLGISLFLNI